jgi:hypothetical protein
MMRFLLPAALAVALLTGSAKADPPTPSLAEVQRQVAAVNAHKSAFGAINLTLGIVDAGKRPVETTLRGRVMM